MPATDSEYLKPILFVVRIFRRTKICESIESFENITALHQGNAAD